MQLLIYLLLTLMPLSNGGEKIDFGTNKAGEDWIIINDGVMGGLSKGKITIEEDYVRFYGNVSLDNNGGFTAFRSPWGKYDLSKYIRIKLRIKGDENTYGLTFETNRAWYLPYYKKEFTLEGDDWKVITIDLNDFDQYSIGRKSGQKINQENISQYYPNGDCSY